MLRDYSISGRISLFEIPAILLTLHSWRVSAAGGGGPVRGGGSGGGTGRLEFMLFIYIL